MRLHLAQSDHGSVSASFTSCLFCPVCHSCSRLLARSRKGRISCRAGLPVADQLQIYAIMGLRLWGTIFPTGSFQHLWQYGNPICCVSRLFHHSVPANELKWLLSSADPVHGISKLRQRHRRQICQRFSVAEVEAGMLAGLRVPPEVDDFLVSVDRLDACAK